MHKCSTPDFAAIADLALRALPGLVARWLPDGKQKGHEWVARNPTRADHKPGSFSVNLNTCEWADFATNDKGGDAIALYAYLYGGVSYSAAGASGKITNRA